MSERNLFDQWLWVHIAVGICGNLVGFSEFIYVLTHVSYEILSNTEGGMRFLSKLPFWPPKGKKDRAVNYIGDPLWGWVGFKIAEIIKESTPKK